MKPVRFCVIAAFVALLFLSGRAAAQAPQDATYGFHLVSWHSHMDACPSDFGATARCNNSNPGLYAIKDRWVAGAYHNSVRKTTVYVGRRWPILKKGPLEVDVAAVAATGYPVAKVVPIVTPTVALQLGDRAAVRLLAMPKAGKWNRTHVLHLSFEIRGR